MKIFFFIAALFALMSCNTMSPDQVKKLENLNFIIGNWQYVNHDTLFFEKWEIQKAGQINGSRTAIIAGDSILLEKLSICYEGADLNLIISKSGKSQKQSFKMVRLIPNDVLFKNDKGNFPTTIQFVYNETGYLYVKLGGRIAGKREKMEYFLEQRKDEKQVRNKE